MITALKEIVRDHINYRHQIVTLAKVELRKIYKGSFFGALWLFARPMVRILIYYFAFAVGLKQNTPVEGYPKFLWFMVGLIPWFYIQNMIPGGAKCLKKHAYLITKIKYPISTIPTFVSLAQFFVHICLVAITMLVFILFGFSPDIYWLQIFFYLAVEFIFMTTWGIFAGLLGAMSKDFVNLVKSVSIAFFWLSGIIYNVYDIDNIAIRNVLLWNPVTIMVNGFRNTFIYKQWFFDLPMEMRNIGIVYLILVILTLAAYRRLKKEVPDVLW